MLAPVARTANIEGFLNHVAHHLKAMEYTLVDALHIYNWISPQPTEEHDVDGICAVLNEFCKAVADMMIDETVMNVDRLPEMIATTPSGASWRAFTYYGQMIMSGNYTLYDYGKHENMKQYGQHTPPFVPIENYKIPTALFSGDID